MQGASLIVARWHRVPLLWRLLGVLLGALLVGGTLRSWLLWREGVALAEARLAEEAAALQLVLPETLCDVWQAQGADAARVARFLQRRVDARPDLVELTWRAPDGTVVVAHRQTAPSAAAPLWLVSRVSIALPQPLWPLHGTTRDCGTLQPRFTAAHVLLPVWQQLQSQLMVVAGILCLIATAAWLMLHSTLRGLSALRHTARAFHAGDHAVRAPLMGAPELRDAAASFNALADEITWLVRQLEAEKEEAQVTLASIGDAVITTDREGRITLLNAAAAKLTGWTEDEALGRPLTEVFHIINETTRMRVENPVERVLLHGKTVALANHTVLISRDGIEYCIEDSAAPIRLPNGTLLGCVLVFHDVTDKKKLLHAVQWQAGHDALTGLPNRALLADRLQRALAAAQRQHTLLGVCLLDLDGFKPVNDRYGHEIGDRLLCEVAYRLQAGLRAEDTVARLGGDEFVLLLGDAHNVEEIYAALRRILAALDAPCCVEAGDIRVLASIGLTIYPMDEADGDTLLRHADQAMYQAKQRGRNRFHLFNVHEDRTTQARQNSLLRLREALQAGELVLHYQPKVDLHNSLVIGMEALLRWQHPAHGLIAPGEFLPLAEQTDLIVDIGEWVIEAALCQMEQWQATGKAWSVSVNIAAHHFQREDFAPRLAQLLARHPAVAPALLDLEILESVPLDDLEQARAQILACQQLGVTLSLDDFGNGYASLRYLKHLPLETIKIDQSFVRGMLDNEQDIALVEAMTNLAHLFQRTIIAEGVETIEHAILLLRLGCDLAQGYGIARPMSASQVADWAQQYHPDPKLALWSGLRWGLDELPLLVAQHDHLQWVRRVSLALDNAPLGLSAQELASHRHCRFGCWYYGHGLAAYGHLPEFAAIEPVHVKVHETGQEIIRLRDSGELDRAREQLKTLLSLKDQILILTHALQQAVLTQAARG